MIRKIHGRLEFKISSKITVYFTAYVKLAMFDKRLVGGIIGKLRDTRERKGGTFREEQRAYLSEKRVRF